VGDQGGQGPAAAAAGSSLSPAGQPGYGSPLSFGARAADAGGPLEQYEPEIAAAEPAEPAAPAGPADTEPAGEQGAGS
jgi:hypothetical protein